MAARIRLLLLLSAVVGVQSWSRIDVGTGIYGINGKAREDGVKMHAGGAPFTEQIAKNMRGENPDVPVSLIARYPMKNDLTWWLSHIHVYCAIVVLTIVNIQLLLPKGKKGAIHVQLGRFLSWVVLPQYFPVAYVLNIMAIIMPVDDWKLAPPMSEWRAQVSYIFPFGVSTTMAAWIAFSSHHKTGPYPWGGKTMAAIGKQVTAASMLFWCTIGLYQCISQATAMGLGDFGMFPVASRGVSQAFWQDVNMILLVVGSTQCLMEYVNYKVLDALARDGNNTLKWYDQHRWGTFFFSFQTIVIFALFLAYFPYCLYGLPEYTCIKSPVFAMPFFLMFIPLVPYFPWAFKFGSDAIGGKFDAKTKPS